ncbi:MAG: FMN-binding protein [Clostridia bacterium]|nr:FMN-binding protein [Clostridia bacterium]
MNKIIELFKANKNDIIKPVAVLLAICVIIPLALAVTNKVTKNRIEQLARSNEKETMLELIKAEKFPEYAYSEGDIAFEYNVAKKDDEVLGYIFVTSAKGYGGDVSVMTAVGTDGKIIEIAITDASGETPGLGQNVKKEKFYSQYAGKSDGVTVVKNGAGGKDTVVAVTGATVSSRAVNKAVSQALEYYALVSGDAEGEVVAE